MKSKNKTAISIEILDNINGVQWIKLNGTREDLYVVFIDEVFGVTKDDDILCCDGSLLQNACQEYIIAIDTIGLCNDYIVNNINNN